MGRLRELIFLGAPRKEVRPLLQNFDPAGLRYESRWRAQGLANNALFIFPDRLSAVDVSGGEESEAWN